VIRGDPPTPADRDPQDVRQRLGGPRERETYGPLPRPGVTEQGSRSANDCVEVADGYAALVPVRDSKTPAARPLVFSAVSWSAFAEGVKGEPGMNTIG